MDNKEIIVDNSLRLIFLSLITFTIFLFYILFITMIGESAIEVPFSSKLTVASIIPQGWSFFTRDPREKKIRVYKVVKNHFASIDLAASSPKYIFGLNRKGRKVTAEIAYILQNANSAWVNFNQEINNIHVDQLKCDTVTINGKNRILSGKLLFQYTEIVPWAWSSKAPLIPFQAKLVYVESNEQKVY